MDVIDDGSSLLESITLQLARLPPLVHAPPNDFRMLNNIARLKCQKALILCSQRRITEAIKEVAILAPGPMIDLLEDTTTVLASVILLECHLKQMNLNECDQLVGSLEAALDQLEMDPAQVDDLAGFFNTGLVGLGCYYSTRLALLRRDGGKAAMELSRWIATVHLKDSTFDEGQDLGLSLSFISFALTSIEVSLPIEVRMAAVELYILLSSPDLARSILIDLAIRDRSTGATLESLIVNNLAVVQTLGDQSSSLALEGFIRSSIDSYSLASILLLKDHNWAALMSLNDFETRTDEGHHLMLLRTAEALIGVHQEQGSSSSRTSGSKDEDPDRILLLFRALECLQQFLQRLDSMAVPPPGFDHERVRQHALAMISYVHLVLGDPASSLAAAEQGMGERSDHLTDSFLCSYAASSLDALGRPFEAIDILRDVRGSSKDISLGLAAMTAREQGNGEDALKILREIDGGSQIFSSYLLMAIGKPDGALEELRKLTAKV